MDVNRNKTFEIFELNKKMEMLKYFSSCSKIRRKLKNKIVKKEI